MGPLLRSCGEVREPIELSFGVMNGVDAGIDVQNGGPCGLKGRGEFWGCLPPLTQWFQWPNFQEKYIQLVHEKLRIFPYVQHIIGIYVSLAFQKCTQIPGRYLGFTSNMQKCNSHFSHRSSQTAT